VGLWQDLGRRIAFLARQSRFDRELDAEIQFHIDARADELTAAGVPRQDALLQARREFGSAVRVSEATRAAWQFRWLDDLLTDVRYAARGFRRSPGFTLTAVLSLALGIGANSTIFSALDAVLWKPLPVARPQSLVRLSITRINRDDTASVPVEYVDQLRRSGIFSDIVTSSNDGLSFSYDDRAERILSEMVSPNFFDFLGVDPILGQGFTPGVRAGQWAPEAVLSYRFWKRRFAGDPGAVGRIIHLNTYPFTIVGVSPPSFFDLSRGLDPELRIPILPNGSELSQIQEISGSRARALGTMARLKSDWTTAQAEAAADAQFQEFLRTSTVPGVRRGGYEHVRVIASETGWPGELAQFHAPLFVLLALVALVLLIACANVANMLLARGMARQRELAVRASIGAGRARLIRQLVAESVLLAVCGGGLGIAVASWAAGALVGFLPRGHINIVLDVHPDARVLTFTFAVSLATGLLFGLVPALQVTRANPATSLKSDSAGSVGVSRRAGLRQTLVVAQVAFSLTLLMVAGLFVRTLSNLRPTDFRVPPDRVLLFTMKPQQEIYDANRIRLLTAELVRRVARLPGVASAALAENGPLGSRTSSTLIAAGSGNAVQARMDWITPGFFETIGVPRIAGRDFTDGDAQGTVLAAIVNPALARMLFGNQNPLGRAIHRTRAGSAPPFEIVGVVSDTHDYNVRTQPAPAVWFAIQQDTPYMPTLHVRTAATADTGSVLAAVRAAFDALDKGFPIFDIKTLERRIDDSLSRERLVADISAVFGVAALLLAGIGLYGVLAYSVTRRTREIGVRMALGSSAASVVSMIAREGLVLTAAGAIAGLVFATLAGRLLAGYVFGVTPTDPALLVTSATAMLGIAMLAVAVPAYRASRVDPLVALRSE
jgi:predicted permease